MARTTRPTVINGLASVRAATRAGSGSKGPKLRSADSKSPPRRAPAKKKPGVAPSRNIARTVLPEKHEIVCPDCGYAFKLQGRFEKTFCPKCRVTLEMTHHVIDKPWQGVIKTIGTVEIKKEGEIKGGRIVAGRVIVSGDITGADISACGRLELCKGAVLDPSKLKINDLVIRKDGTFRIPGTLACRNVQVEGTLRAKVFSEGVVTVKPAGLLQGEIHTAHLVVEAGGGLKARMYVSKAPGQEPNKTTARKRGGKSDGK